MSPGRTVINPPTLETSHRQNSQATKNFHSTVCTGTIPKESECGTGVRLFLKPALIFPRYVTQSKVLYLAALRGRGGCVGVFTNVILRVKQHKWRYPEHPASGTQQKKHNNQQQF